ncbi:MAG: tetrahydromethanopterin S-methyltransferase subunit B [Methanopyri archaeon]|nr:tetrahydromethanopterin S-methyltransferase subunit B [Methanopyri archaeon]
MPYGIVDQDACLVLEAVTGAVGEWREDVISLDVMPLYDKVEELDKYVTDMVHALDPSTVAWGAFHGRQGAHKRAAWVTNFAHGFVIGLMVLSIIIFTTVAMYKLHALRLLGI